MKPYFLLAAFPLALMACAQSSPNSTSSAATDPALLKAYHWQLTDARTAAGQRINTLFVQADKPVQLDFDNNRVSVSNTCNRMGGGYAVSSGKLQLGQLASTLMSCANAKLNQLDREIGGRLQGNMHYLLQPSDQPQLTLTTTGGDKLVFTGIETPETRYGGNGETVFLEVAAKTKACSHPLIPNMQCLQVRQIKYDEKGLKTAQGSWQSFYQTIDGYTHQDGVRNILRVKRYRVANPPADAPDSAYVLDMVVETDLSGK